MLQSNMLSRSSVLAPGPPPITERAIFRVDVVRLNMVVLLRPGEPPVAGDTSPVLGSAGGGPTTAYSGPGWAGGVREFRPPRWRLPHRRFGESLRDVDGASVAQYRWENMREGGQGGEGRGRRGTEFGRDETSVVKERRSCCLCVRVCGVWVWMYACACVCGCICVCGCACMCDV